MIINIKFSKTKISLSAFLDIINVFCISYLLLHKKYYHKLNSLKGHTFTISQCLWVRSEAVAGLGSLLQGFRLPSSCQLGLVWEGSELAVGRIQLLMGHWTKGLYLLLDVGQRLPSAPYHWAFPAWPLLPQSQQEREPPSKMSNHLMQHYHFPSPCLSLLMRSKSQVLPTCKGKKLHKEWTSGGGYHGVPLVAVCCMFHFMIIKY